MSDLDSPSASEEPGKLERSNTSKQLKRQNTKAKDQVAEQTENFNTPGTIWYAVKKGDLETALRVIKENPSKLNERGPVGETPLHLCFLFNAPIQKEIARRLIDQYPDSIRYIYENPLYYGETVLHIAIVNKDFEMVRWLVQRDKGLLNICATGSFFQDGSPCYYGEFPLAFAVCTNNIPVVSYLLLSGADLFAQDTSGNGLLHMCVIHDLQRLYTFVITEEKKRIEAEEKEGKKVQRVPLSRMRNKADYTPLTLAAYLGKKDMFDFIFQQQRENQWTYGPVSCNIYPLEELDTLQEESDDSKKHQSALEIIVNEKHLELLMLPRIVDLLHMKWKHYAGRYFYKRCIQTTFFMVVLSLAVILRSPNFTYKNEWHDIFRAICEVFVVLGWLYKGSKELAELWGSGLQYFNQAGSAFLENNLSFLFLVFLPCAVICEAADSRARFFFVFWAILFAWTYELTLLLGFKLTGPFVIMIYKMLTRDIARFASIYLLVLFGHTTAWYVIEQPTGEEVFHEYFFRLKNDFLVLMGQISFEDFADVMQEGYNWLSSLLLLFHIIFVFIMLLNVLIGMMSDTFNDIKDRSDQEWHLAYSQIIFSVESEIPSSVLKGANYWTLVNNKRFLQVQDVSKEYFGAIVEDESTAPSIMQSALERLDKNNDGIISADELKQAESQTIELKKQESRGGVVDAETEKPQNIGIVDGPLDGRLDPATYTM